MSTQSTCFDYSEDAAQVQLKSACGNTSLFIQHKLFCILKGYSVFISQDPNIHELNDSSILHCYTQQKQQVPTVILMNLLLIYSCLIKLKTT